MSGLWASGIRRRTTRRPENYSSSISPSALTRSSICMVKYASFLVTITAFAVVLLLVHIKDGILCESAVRTRAHNENADATLPTDLLEKISSNIDKGSVRHNEQRNNTVILFPFPSQTNFSGILARSFEPWAHPLPCFEPEEDWQAIELQNSPAESGFLFVKPYKTGSSTTSGINLRIARNVAARNEANFGICRG